MVELCKERGSCLKADCLSVSKLQRTRAGGQEEYAPIQLALAACRSSPAISSSGTRDSEHADVATSHARETWRSNVANTFRDL